MANVTRSGRKQKDEDNNLKRRHIGKGSSSESPNSDTSGLRRSTRETPSKKESASSPVNIRKSERIEKRTPPSTPVNKKTESVEKQRMPSPLRRSEKGDNPRSSNSSGSRKSEKVLDSSEKSKMENSGDSGRCKTASTRDGDKAEEKDRKPVRVVLGKKRLDARSYRASLLKPQAKKTQESDRCQVLKEQDEASRVDGDHTGASSSEEVEDVVEGIAKDSKEIGEQDVGHGSVRVVEEPSLSLGKIEGGMLKDTGEIELSCSSRKRKLHMDELEKSDNRDTSPVPKCSYNPLQPSPGVLATEVVGDAEKVQVDCSEQHNLLNVSTTSTSEGRSISGDACLDKHDTVDSPRGKRKSEELNSEAFKTAANAETHCSADPVTSSPCDSKRVNFSERCESCSKRRRLDVDFQKCSKCTCNYEKNDHSLHNSSTENGDELRSRACTGLNEECGGKMQPELLMDNQLEYDHNACATCKLGGKLLCCDGKGCKRNYHLDCLDPPLKVAPLGVWYCFQCIKRMIQFGVHSVSEGVESICDHREEEVPACAGFQKQKQYLVKYKGLAHVHNRWIPEHQLLLESPSAVAKFKKNQAIRWKLEWTKPQRLVRKRSLISTNKPEENFGDCRYEWFVKWNGLGYEHATWELENAPFLSLPEVIALKRDYEARLEKAVLVSNTSREKSLGERECPPAKFSASACRNMSRLDNDHLYFVNKLREHWHKNQNVVVVEDQERILKVVQFILLSLQSGVCRPFLIISSSSASISAWETEFMRSAASVNVVAYSGSKNARERIRSFEFYEDGGCVMLQVLLSPIDAIVEDLEALELIGWEAIVVDECQRSSISKHFEQIKKLPSGFKLVLFNGPIKETVAEYLNLLSFIEPESDRIDDGNLKVNAGDTISTLKERLSRFVACERKSESSKFVEYWVPVHLSNVQLEQYCATLLSNSLSLCSSSKNDPVGALRDILISVRKCCDHPYLMDQPLQSLLTKDLPETEILDVGVNASGKLQLLDKVLSEIRKRGLRVLILFQSIGGSGRNSIGDILDDFLRQRFGPDSYERVDSGLLSSKKQAALNMFNNKGRGRFAFLLENRACYPSIKLSSVDMVILFDSDWNPLNDLRALQKITLDSQFEQLKVFRLYSSGTVEEKVLNLAKQDTILESNIQNINRSTSHMLLLWGAYSLFHKLDEFHSCTPSSNSNISAEQSFLNDVVDEFLSQLPDNVGISELKNSKLVLMAQQSGMSYSKNITLPGEKEMQSRDEELPHVLWTNILDGRYPRWRYTSGPSQRIRRKVQYFGEPPKKPQETIDVARKKKKVVSNTLDSNTLKNCLDNQSKLASLDKQGASVTSACNGSRNLTIASTKGENHVVTQQPGIYVPELNEEGMHDSQKDLHFSLKPVISKLCEILELPDDVKSMAGRFLEYIIKNHNVCREPVTIFQAFQISLCWSAASLLKYKVSRTKSLSLAKQQLNFHCKEEETELIYSKLRVLKKMFAHQEECIERISTDKSSPRNKEKHHLHSRDSQSATFSQEFEDGEFRESSKSPKDSIQVDSLKQKKTGVAEIGSGLSKNEFSKSIKKVKKTYTLRMRKLYQRQMEEFEKFNENREKILEKEKADLEIKHKLESALIRSLHTQLSVRSEKLKVVDQEFARKKEEGNIRMEEQKRKLSIMQRKARNEEKHMRAHWLEEAKSGRSVAKYATLPLSDSGFRGENLGELISGNSDSRPTVEQVGDCKPGGFGYEKVSPPSSSLQKQDMNVVLPELPVNPVLVEACATVPDDIVSTEPRPVTLPLDVGGIEANTLETDSAAAADMGLKQQKNVCVSNSASPSLCQDLVVPPLGLEHAATSQDCLVPPFQVPVDEHFVPVDEHSEPSGTTAGLQVLNLPSCGVQNLSRDESQTLQPEDAVIASQVDDAVTAVQNLSRNESQILQPEEAVITSQVDDAIAVVENLSRDESQTLQPEDAVIVSQVDDAITVVQPASNLQLSTSADPSSEVQNFSQDENQTLADIVPSNQVNDVIPVVQLQMTPSADGVSTVQSHPETTECTRVGRELTSGSLENLEAPIRATVVDQHVMIDQSDPVPGNLFSHAASQQTQVPAPCAVPTSTEPSQCQVPASTGPDREERIERDSSIQQEGVQIQLPVVVQNEVFNHSDLLLDNQVTAQPTQVPAQPPAVVHTEVLNSSISRHNAQSPHLPIESSVSGNGAHLSDLRSMNHFSDVSFRPPQMSSSRLPQQVYPDPLQNELGRLRREEEQANKMHEDEKVRISSECEKEIEAIRRKYTALLQDAETEFAERKKTLETNYNVVYMNRILAEAFRLKCDSKSAGASGLQQGASSGSTQQVLRLSSPQIAQRPVQMPVQQTSSPATPPVQMVRQPSALFSSSPVRSQFCQVHSSPGNHQMGTELRAPAPHLQPYRPVTSTNHGNSNPTSISSQRTPRLPSQMSVPFSRAQQPENMSGSQSCYDASLSAVELLMDMERNPSQSPQNLLPPLQDLGQSIDAWGTQEMTVTPRSVNGPVVRPSNSREIVCLSDDD